MARRNNNNLFSSLFSLRLFYIISSCYLLITTHSCNAKKDVHNKVEGLFVFGSSLVDNGNNNFLSKSNAKADYLPYGIDFPLVTTGRFTNGLTVIDLIGRYLRIPGFIPVFLDPTTKGRKIRHGVDFASGGSGILNSTGFVAGEVITLNQQITNFEEVTLPDLVAQLGHFRSKKYIFVVGSGGNDYTFNYFLRNPNNVTIQDFTANLITTLSNQLKRLYKLGGRKFVLMGLNPLGCSPYLKVLRPTLTGCLEPLNQAAQLFNANLKTMVDGFKKDMPGSNLVIVNSYHIINEIFNHPTHKGYDIHTPCCDVNANGVLCKRVGGRVCLDAHLYFDGIHPSESLNLEIIDTAFTSNNQTQVYPINIKQLSML